MPILIKKLNAYIFTRACAYTRVYKRRLDFFCSCIINFFNYRLVAKVLSIVPTALILGLILATGLLSTNPPQASAVSSSTINFQARLLSISGNIVPDGNYHVEFKLFNASSSSGSSQGSCSGDANCLWVETRTTGDLVRVVNGYLTVNLGSVTAFASTINWDQEHWLTMNIGGTSGPSWDGEMSPRVKLTALPYAFRAGKLALTSGANIGTLAFGSVTNDPVLTLPNETGTVCSTGSVCSGYQAAGSYANVGLSNLSGVAINTSLLPGSDNSIDLGNATTASWRSSYFDTSVLTPLIDTVSAGTLNLGTTTATAIGLNQNTTVAAAKTFTVTSGATSLTGATSGDALTVSNSTSTGNVAVFKDNSTAVATIADGGAATFQNSTNSITAFQIQNASGTGLFISDTSNLINSPGIAPSTTATTQTTTEIVDADSVGPHTSMAIGIDGLPIISYREADTSGGGCSTNECNLKVTKCTNASCSTNSTTEFEDVDDVGQDTSIAIGTDGLAIISHRNVTNTNLQVSKCANINCTSLSADTEIVDTDVVGVDTFIAIGTDGLPIISHYEGDTGGGGCGAAGECNLKVTKCTNASCSTNSTTEFENGDDVGEHSSIAIGTDGLPIISYENDTSDNLRIAKCANISCTSLSADTEIIDGDEVGEYTSIAIGTDGLPIISHKNRTGENLQISKCANTACTSLSADTEIVDADNTGFYTSIAIGTDGLPIISHDNNTGGNLQISKCATKDCASASGTALTSGVDLGTLAAGFRSIYSDTLNFGKENARLSLDDVGNFKVNGLRVAADDSISLNLQSSTTAFQVQNSSGSTLFNTNTSTTVQLVSNGNFETSINGWSAKGSSTVSFDSTAANAKYGSASLKVVTTAAANDGASYSLPIKASTQYSLSLWLKLSSGSATTINIGNQDNAIDVNCLTGQTVTTTWTQYNCTFTSGGTINGTTNLYVKQTDASVRTIYIDGVSLVAAASAEAFNPGGNQLDLQANTGNISLNQQNSGELQAWQTNANALPAARYNSAVVTANGYAYLIGGYDGSAVKDTVYYAKLNTDGSTGA